MRKLTLAIIHAALVGTMSVTDAPVLAQEMPQRG
jgi:hypothetical protein